MAKHNVTGKWGEDVATEFLIIKGYDIVERNWRLEHLEIDIIARNRQRIIFVEVKTRSSAENADPRLIITKQKLNNMCRAANAYMRMYNINFTAQFDIIIITGNKESYMIDHIPDAFFPPMKTY